MKALFVQKNRLHKGVYSRFYSVSSGKTVITTAVWSSVLRGAYPPDDASCLEVIPDLVGVAPVLGGSCLLPLFD